MKNRYLVKIKKLQYHCRIQEIAMSHVTLPVVFKHTSLRPQHAHVALSNSRVNGHKQHSRKHTHIVCIFTTLPPTVPNVLVNGRNEGAIR